MSEDPLLIPSEDGDTPRSSPATLVVAAAALFLTAVAVVALLVLFPDLRGTRGAAERRPPDDGDGISAIDPDQARIASLLRSFQDQWRRGRFGGDFFTAVLEETLPPGSAAIQPELDLLRTWAEGGLALSRGNREGAHDLIARIAAHPAFLLWLPVLPGRFVGQPGADPAQFEEWRVDLFWGDPLGEAGARVEERIATLGERRVLLLARAVLAHLDGDDAGAAAQADDVAAAFADTPSWPVVARFAGDSHLWSGDVDGALDWYARSLPQDSPAEVAAILRTLNLEGGAPLLERACAADLPPACRYTSAPRNASTTSGGNAP